jgi:capsular polysaccharide biosynthesis protein
VAQQEPPIRQYLRLLKRQGWLILLVPAIALAGAASLVHRQESVYRATMGILVAQGGGSVQAQLGNLPLTQTMTNILESDVIATRVRQKLNLQTSSSDLLEKITVEVKPDSSVLSVSYDSPSKQQALRVLDALATEFRSLIRQQLGVSGSFKQTGPLRIVVSLFNPPHLEPGRVSPRPTKTLAFAVVLGLVLGLVLAIARDSLDDRIRGRRQAEEWFGAPVIGVLPEGFFASRNSDRTARNAPGVQALELLGANVQLRSATMGRTLLVTGALQDDATAPVVANLGIALARAGQDVVCVETDGRGPSLRRLFDVADESGNGATGVLGVLEGKLAATDAFVRVPLQYSSNGGVSVAGMRGGQLMLLPVGEAASPGGARPVSPEHLGELVGQLSAGANHVLFDCPRLLSAAHGLSLASVVDGVLIVAEDGRTPRDRAEALRAALDTLGVDNVAVVLIERRPLRRIRSLV